MLIGGIVISLLGISFGTSLMIAGSLMTWQSDQVLGIYNKSGWSLNNLLPGDGKLTFVLGVICLLAFILGALLRRRVYYGIAFLYSVVVLSFSVVELVSLALKAGVVGPGHGLYMMLGAGVVGALCSLGGFFMMGGESR